MADRSTILVERVDLTTFGAPSKRAFVIRLNRPDQLNAIDQTMLDDLDDALDDVSADRTASALLITGAGRAFSAGGDLTKYLALQRDPVEFPRFVADFHRVTGRLMDLKIPAIGLVNGVTAAGGLELLLNCDVVLVARSARIGDGHLNFGQMGGGGVLTLLPRTIGRYRATELILSGRFLDAEEVVAWGLASRVVDDDMLLDEGLAFAADVARKSPLAVANAKEVLVNLWAEGTSVDQGRRYEMARNVYYCLNSEDAPEGLRAFAERRDPDFTGR